MTWLLGGSFGFRSYPILLFLLNCFDAGSAGAVDLACFNFLEIVEATLISIVREASLLT